MTDEESRKAYEDTVKSACGEWLTKRYIEMDGSLGGYIDDQIIAGWDAWQAAIRWMQSQQEWRSMDSAPRDGSPVLLLMTVPTAFVVIAWWTESNGGNWSIYGGYADDNKIDGWLPLPPLPKEGI